MGIVISKKITRRNDHAYRSFYFRQSRAQEAKNAEQIWKESCAPLMIQQPGCLSEKLLRSTDDPREFISYSEWRDQQSIDAYRVSFEAHEEIKKHAQHLHGDRPSVNRYELV